MPPLSIALRKRLEVVVLRSRPLAENAHADWQHLFLARIYAALHFDDIDSHQKPYRIVPQLRSAWTALLDELPQEVFTADDSLGWAFQFWQAPHKDAVNQSGAKVGGAALHAVTQLFTEPYMARFLLHNSLGAWWTARHPGDPPPLPLEFLRHSQDGTPSAGAFPHWPRTVKELKVLDPCCGSGHLLVAAFHLLVPLRMRAESLSPRAACDAVLNENLFGLELDPRCLRLAELSLQLAAWNFPGAGGQRPLPRLHLACSGILDFVETAGETCFTQAADLGSLIDPQRVAGSHAEGSTLYTLLAGHYHLVLTNVPYLTRAKQNQVLRSYLSERYPLAKADLGTAFVERCLSFCTPGGCAALVTPQNWLFLRSYRQLREKLLQQVSWHMLARLGTGAFANIGGEVVNVALLILSRSEPRLEQNLAGLNVAAARTADAKAHLLRSGPLSFVPQLAQLQNPDHRITLDVSKPGKLLGDYAHAYQGISPADLPRYGRYFWEVGLPHRDWRFWQGSLATTTEFGGRQRVLWWNQDLLDAVQAGTAYLRGAAAWGKQGVAVKLMGSLPCTLSTGEAFDTNVAILVPHLPSHLPALWAFCQSPAFAASVRRIDQKVNVTNATLEKVPFDLQRWQTAARKQGPLPGPFSHDPTQWLFDGDWMHATEPLHAAVARLLGYRWPMQKADAWDRCAVREGILCLSRVEGQPSAAERLHHFLGLQGSEQEFDRNKLDHWLRHRFFAEHCRLFRQRPFLWHIWDGRRNGFAALINYQQLDGPKLVQLIDRCVGDWIVHLKKTNAEVAAVRAAQHLQHQLARIREGEPPLDVFVRWKPRERQPVGWQPDLDDGVRVNIRPFVLADVLRNRPKIHWRNDRGQDAYDAEWGVERCNDRHVRRAEKRKSASADA